MLIVIGIFLMLVGLVLSPFNGPLYHATETHSTSNKMILFGTGGMFAGVGFGMFVIGVLRLFVGG